MSSNRGEQNITTSVARVRRVVWNHYRVHGRHDLPWRKTHNPYRILVSEVMLQQTQVTRVIPKYKTFIRMYPSLDALAHASLSDVLMAWQGLGYNRRAKSLYDTARMVCERYGGRLPCTEVELRALPGIGQYTARAILAFAYNKPVALLETNIRTVCFAELLQNRSDVSDSELLVLADRLLDRTRPREWQWALMDYGAYLKARGVRLNHTSKHYVKQGKFKGSDREIRGALIRYLTETKDATTHACTQALSFPQERIMRQLTALVRDGLVRRVCGRWAIY